MTPGESELTGIDRERLLRELEDLDRRLKKVQPSGARDEPEALLALVRLVRGLTAEDWRDFSHRHQIDNYMALPLDGSRYPVLEELLRLIRRLSHESRHDALTGLLNRRAFQRRLDIEMERSRRMDTLLSLAILDVDDFKQVNDTFGHPAGDEVLRLLARLLRRHTRKINVTARIGGEEFAVLLPGSGPFQTRSMLLRLQDRLRESPLAWQGEDYRATFSAGISSFRGESQISAEQLIEEADQALYLAKDRGKDRIRCASRSLRLAQPGSMVEPEEREMLLYRQSRKKKAKSGADDPSESDPG
ncbi:MAG TPA: GGDEF domain-containing protein [Acidobacteriota bacterium]|nr:GGDEF domain-containing protein [Acidobacteriota bacterium]